MTYKESEVVGCQDYSPDILFCRKAFSMQWYIDRGSGVNGKFSKYFKNVYYYFLLVYLIKYLYTDVTVVDSFTLLHTGTEPPQLCSSHQ